MADGYDDAPSERAYPLSQAGPSQPRIATLNGNELGDYGSIHQGDQNVHIGQLNHVNNYACPPSWTGSHPRFDPHPDRPRTPCWTVPFGRNKDFVGRELILDRLLDLIPPNADEDDCQRTVISGLGGVGKTQIALEAAFRIRKKYPDCHVFWVPAINTTTFENAYREIGREMKIQAINNDKANIKLLVKAALNQSSDSWLLIIDNADDATLFGEATDVASLSYYLPFALKGSILFTTRNDEVSQRLDVRRENIIPLREMSQSEAMNMLQKGLPAHQMSDSQSLQNLLEFLSNLPLALKQASAYMTKTGIKISQYLEYCRSSDENLIKLLSKNFDDRARYETTHNPIATTWMISFRAISRDNPLAANYLQFMAFLAEKDIPRYLLPPARDELDALEAIGTLKAYGFINERECRDAYDMHRLVRLVIQNWMARSESELQTQITAVMQRLDVAIPWPFFENKDVWARYLPHAIIALKFQDYMYTLDPVLRSRILHKAARGLLFLGKILDAKQMNQQALDLQIKISGDEHPDTLAVIDTYIMIASYGDHTVEFAQISRKVLELRTIVLGAEHPGTLASMHILSKALYKQRYYKESEQMSRQALELQRKVLGAKYPNTLPSMYILSLVLYEQSYYKEAEQMSWQTLELHRKVLGAEHPEIPASMLIISMALHQQGYYNEAEQMARQALELYTKVLGAEHSDTLTSRKYVALYEQGQYREAECEDDQLTLVHGSTTIAPKRFRGYFHMARRTGSLFIWIGRGLREKSAK
ncbi:P-loop containing nucleoside triphosphate hydrolase protein [Trichoderma velutinum]